MEQRNNLILLTVAMTLIVGLVFSQSYPLPNHMSPYDMANWVIRSGHIASGTATPPTGSVQPGCLYVDESIATQPQLWRYSGSNWYLISGGTRKHSELQELDYASSGHTGFAASSQIPTNASFTLSGLAEKNFSGLTNKPTNASYTLSGLAEKEFANLTGKPTNASYTLTGLSEKNFSSLTNKPTTLAGYGITDGTLQASFAADVATLALHMADNFDPHGSEMTVSEQLNIGSGSFTVDTYSEDDGVYVISATETKLLGYLRIIEVEDYTDNAAAITAGLATGTLYHDASGVVRIVY